MATRDEPNIVKDGYTNFLGGVDYTTAPNLLESNQLSGGSNVTVRAGYADQRPSFDLKTIQFPTPEIATWFKTKIFQGYGEYIPPVGDTYIICSVGGRLFRLDPWNQFVLSEVTPTLSTTATVAFISPGIGASINVTVDSVNRIPPGLPINIGGGSYIITLIAGNVLTLTNINAIPGILIPIGSPVVFLDPNNSLLPRAWFEQGEQYLFIQDGESACIIFDGAGARRSIGATTDKPEVPCGTSMVYVLKRLWVALVGGQVVAGDIFGGSTKIYNFTETLFLQEGGGFKVNGEITALTEIPILDTSLGQGPIQVFTLDSVGSINVPTNRNLWKDLNYPIQTVALKNSGATSQYSTIIVNGDIYYRSPDGLRSYMIARRDFQAFAGNVAISSEMSRLINEDAPFLLSFSSAVLFDNRLLFTINPLPVGNNGAYHFGIGVLDFDLLTTLRGRERPVYDPEWNGPNVVMLGKIGGKKGERAFIFARNAAGENEVWEINRRGDFDSGCNLITSIIETRSMLFPTRSDTSGTSLNQIHNLAIWIDNLKEQVDFVLEWKPDQYPCWFPWHTWSVCQKTIDCPNEPTVCEVNVPLQPGYRTRLMVPSPTSVCNTMDDKPADHGYEFMVRLKWTGRCRIKKLVMKVKQVQELPMEATTC